MISSNYHKNVDDVLHYFAGVRGDVFSFLEFIHQSCFYVLARVARQANSFIYITTQTKCAGGHLDFVVPVVQFERQTPQHVTLLFFSPTSGFGDHHHHHR